MFFAIVSKIRSSHHWSRAVYSSWSLLICIFWWGLLTLISLNSKSQVWVISPYSKIEKQNEIKKFTDEKIILLHILSEYDFLYLFTIGLVKINPHLVLNAKTGLPWVSMQTLIYNISKSRNNFKKPFGESCFIMKIFKIKL